MQEHILLMCYFVYSTPPLVEMGLWTHQTKANNTASKLSTEIKQTTKSQTDSSITSNPLLNLARQTQELSLTLRLEKQ